jgi:hypothetical protein
VAEAQPPSVTTLTAGDARQTRQAALSFRHGQATQPGTQARHPQALAAARPPASCTSAHCAAEAADVGSEEVTSGPELLIPAHGVTGRYISVPLEERIRVESEAGGTVTLYLHRDGRYHPIAASGFFYSTERASSRPARAGQPEP